MSLPLPVQPGYYKASSLLCPQELRFVRVPNTTHVHDPGYGTFSQQDYVFYERVGSILNPAPLLEWGSVDWRRVLNAKAHAVTQLLPSSQLNTVAMTSLELFLEKTKPTHEPDYKLLEAVADIAYDVGYYIAERKGQTHDSREIVAAIIEQAKNFEAAFVDDEDSRYLSEISTASCVLLDRMRQDGIVDIPVEVVNLNERHKDDNQ